MNLSKLISAAESAAGEELIFRSFVEIELQRPRKLALQKKLIRVDFRPVEQPPASLRGVDDGHL